jgi:hypothetical protein
MTPEEAEAALSRLAFRNERLREKLSEVEEDRDGFREQAKWLKKDVAKLEEALKEAGATTIDAIRFDLDEARAEAKRWAERAAASEAHEMTVREQAALIERLRDGLKSVANCDEMDCYLCGMADDLVRTPTPGAEALRQDRERVWYEGAYEHGPEGGGQPNPYAKTEEADNDS